MSEKNWTFTKKIYIKLDIPPPKKKCLMSSILGDLMFFLHPQYEYNLHKSVFCDRISRESTHTDKNMRFSIN